MLRALGLAKPVVGVFRSPRRKFYQVTWIERGRQQCAVFSWKGDDELEAYQAAIEFRKLAIAPRGRERLRQGARMRDKLEGTV